MLNPLCCIPQCLNQWTVSIILLFLNGIYSHFQRHSNRLRFACATTALLLTWFQVALHLIADITTPQDEAENSENSPLLEKREETCEATLSRSVRLDPQYHDDVIKWKQFPPYWSFVRVIHRSPVTSPHKVQGRGALILSLICPWINGWVNNREVGDLRRQFVHYDVTVMTHLKPVVWNAWSQSATVGNVYLTRVNLCEIKRVKLTVFTLHLFCRVY